MSVYIIRRNGHLPDVPILRNFVHDVHHEALNDRTKGPGSGILLHRLLRNRVKRVLLKVQLHIIQRKELLILLQNGISRLLQNSHQHILIQILQRADNGKTTDKLGNHAKRAQIIIRHLGENVFLLAEPVLQLRGESHGGLLRQSLFDDSLQCRKRTAADEQNIACIHGHRGDHTVLGACSDRNVHLASFQEL